MNANRNRAAKKSARTLSISRARRQRKSFSIPHSDLELACARLEKIQAVIATAIAALRYQHAELDAEIAVTLSQAVADPLMTELDRLKAVLAQSSIKVRKRNKVD